MKVTELIYSLIEYLKKYGDNEVIVNLLTENQANPINITGNFCDDKYRIECDINDLKSFKKNLK
jgi:hypothetical protein